MILFFLFNVKDVFTLAILIVFAVISSLLPDLDNKISKGTDLADKAAIILSFAFVISNTCTNSFSCFLDSSSLKTIFIYSLVLIGAYFIIVTFIRPVHRGMTHSLVLCFGFSVLIYFLLGFNFAVAGLIGYGSHLLADRELKLV